jgi:hypothetical protein
MHVPRNRLSACEGAVVPAGGIALWGELQWQVETPRVFCLSFRISYENCSN